MNNSVVKKIQINKTISMPCKRQAHISFNGYENKNNVYKAQPEEIMAGTLITAPLLRLVQWGIEKLSRACSYALMRGKEFTSKENIDKVVSEMKLNNKLTTEVHFLDNTNVDILKQQLPHLKDNLDIVAAGKNAFFSSVENIAVAPEVKPSLILHELGHATNYAKKGVMSFLQKARVLGMYAPMAAVFLNTLSGKRQDKKQSFIERNAGKIGFLAMLPTIIEEAAASIRGISASKKCLGSSVQLGALKRNYFLAWMTYLLGGIGVAVATKLMVLRENEQTR